MQQQMITLEFEGTTVPVHFTDDQPCWLARDLGRAIGYASDGKGLVDNVSGKWADEFVEGRDFVRKWPESLKGAKTAPPSGSAPIVLFESGVHRVCMLTRKSAGKRFRDWLALEVLPAIHRTGRYEMPNAQPEPAKVLDITDRLFAAAAQLEGTTDITARSLICAGVRSLGVSVEDHREEKALPAYKLSRYAKSVVGRRAMLGVSQQRLASAAGLSIGSIRNLETGARESLASTKAKIEAGFVALASEHPLALAPPPVPADVVEAEPVDPKSIVILQKTKLPRRAGSAVDVCKGMDIAPRFANAVGRALGPLKDEGKHAEQYKLTLESGREEAQWRYDLDHATRWLAENHPDKVASWQERSAH